MLTRRILLASAAVIGLAFGAAPTRAAEEVEIIHWWTSGGEAAALQVLRGNLEKQGVGWKDAAIAGGGGDQARTVLAGPHGGRRPAYRDADAGPRGPGLGRAGRAGRL